MTSSTPPDRRAGIGRWPIFGLSLAALIGDAALSASATAAPALPSGGHVAEGAATISSAGGVETIDQTSGKAVIDWTSFSVGQGGKVQFANGSGATLNDVTGDSGAEIAGLVSGTGSVYVIDPAGLIIGRDGIVQVGGTFMAATLDPSLRQFLAGGPLAFAGKSHAAVVNLGRIGSLGGDVALIGATVANHGTIAAPKGDAALAAGYEVVVQDRLLNDGKFSVALGGRGTSATNAGLIQAAEAELRANGGNVYALAGNTGSVIEASGVSTNDGNVFLVASGGDTVAQGDIVAKTASGAGGLVETSGEKVDFDGLRVTAANWTVDPTNLTVDAAAASTINSDLATTSVTLETTATGASGPGTQRPGPGDITIDAPITWSSSNTLSLDSYHGINILAPITVAGPGVLDLVEGADGGNTETFIQLLNFGLTSTGFSGSVSFTDTPGSGQSFEIDNSAVTLAYSLSELETDAYSGGSFVLAVPLNLSGVTLQNPGIFGVGTFLGLGNAISNLTIDGSGLFVSMAGGGHYIAYVNLENVTVNGQSYPQAGGIIGTNSESNNSEGGLIYQSYVSGSISGDSDVGAIAGRDGPGGTLMDDVSAATVLGTSDVGGITGISEAFGTFYGIGGVVGSISTATVTGGSDSLEVGGLVGLNTGYLSGGSASGATVSGTRYVGGAVGYNALNGTIENGTESSDSVSGTAYVGGLVGGNGGAITSASAEAPSATGTTAIGGLVGYNQQSGSISDSDAEGDAVGGAESAYAGGLVGLNVGSLAGGSVSGATVTGDRYVGGAVGANAGGVSGGVESSDAVSGTYYVGGLVGLNEGQISASSAESGRVLGTELVGGLVGYSTSAGTITLSGASGATVSISGADFVGGLVGLNAGQVGQSFSTDTVSGGSSDYAGGLVGENESGGSIANTYATGSVAGSTFVGGLVGLNAGSVETSWASAAVSGKSGVGGAVGQNNSGATLSDLYWDEGTTGVTRGVGAGSQTGTTAIGGTTGLSPFSQSTYQGFNFSTIWTINGGTSRPYLQGVAPQTPPN